MAQRGLVFWILRLRSLRCPTCERDVIYRQHATPPVWCRWCGCCMSDFIKIAQRMSRSMDRLAAEFARFNSVRKSLDDQVEAFWYALSQTPVDTEPNNG